MRLTAHYYRQYDADWTRATPAAAFGGWTSTTVDLAPAHTALVVLHAWDNGDRERFPGLWRCCPELERSEAISRATMPPLLAAVRRADVTVLHVVCGRRWYEDQPGYRRAEALAGPTPPQPQVTPDPAWEALQALRARLAFPGAHNTADCDAHWRQVHFHPGTAPQPGEGVARDAHQLWALAREAGVNHLVYSGFFLDWCMLMSPGGMVDMSRYGMLCSVLRDATAAVENHETAPERLAWRLGLWRVSVGFGFVFDTADFIAALPGETAGPRG